MVTTLVIGRVLTLVERSLLWLPSCPRTWVSCCTCAGCRRRGGPGGAERGMEVNQPERASPGAVPKRHSEAHSLGRHRRQKGLTTQ